METIEESATPEQPEWIFTKDGWEPSEDDDTPPGMIEMVMLTGHGDVKKIWNAANSDEVEDARRTFNHLVKEKGYLAFRVNPDTNEKSTQIREFDPEAGKMILMAQVAGG